MRHCYLVLSVIVFVLSGCVPLPHLQQTKPAINGVIVLNGLPLSGVQVSSCKEELDLERCERTKQTMTDSQGVFRLSGERTFEGFVFLLGDPLYSYRIDVTYKGLKLSWGYGGVGYSPKLVKLRCEVSEKLACIQVQ